METLQKVMFDVPSDHTIEKVIIDEQVIEKTKEPEYIYNNLRTPVCISIDSDKLSSSKESSSDAS